MKTYNIRYNRFHFWLLSLAFIFTFELKAQTVFVFNQSSASYDFQNPATWTNNAVPQNGDILSFVGIGFNNITNVPSISLSQLINNGGGITLNSATTGTGVDFQVDNISMTAEIGFATTTAFNITIGNVMGTSGRFSYNSGISVTITGTFIDQGIDFYGGWSAASLAFANGSIYKADFNTSYITFANWLTGSTVSITGLTNSNQVNNTNQVFYNFYFDSPTASASSILLGNITCLGTFGVKTIGGISLNNGGSGGNYSLNHLYLNDGTIYVAYHGILNISGNITQTGGVFMYNSGQFNLNGTSNQEVMITNPGNCDITIVNTGSSGNNIISLTGNSLFNSLDINAGVVQLNAFTHTIAGSMGSTSGDMTGSTLSGLVFPGNPGGTTTIPPGTGTLQTLIMNRQYSNSVYLGGNLTITGDLQTYDNGDLELNGFDLIISGRLVNNSNGVSINGASTSSLFFTDGSSYIHNIDGGSIPIANWLTGSSCSITGMTNNGVGNTNQSFYDFSWDSQNQIAEVDLMVNSAITTVRGTMFIKTSGSSTINFSNYQGGLISNNFIQTGGSFGGSFGTVTWLNTGNFAIAPLATFTGGHGNMQITLTGSNVDLTTSGTFFNLSGSCSISLNAPNCTDAFKMTSDWTIQANADWNSPTLVLINGVLDLNGYSLKHSGKLARGNACASINGGSTSSLYFSNTGGSIDIPKITNGLYNFYAGSDVSANITQLESLTITGGLTIAGSGNYNVGSDTLQLPPYVKASDIHQGGNSRLIASGSSVLVFPENSLYVHDINGGNIPIATWSVGSTASITGVTGNQPGNLGSSTFYNLVCDSPAQTVGAGLAPYASDGTLTITGTLTVKNTGTGDLSLSQYNGCCTSSNLYVGSLSLMGGTFVGNVDSNFGPSANLYISGDYYQSPSAVFASSGPTTNSTGFDLHVYFTGDNSTIGGILNITPTNDKYATVIFNKNNFNTSIDMVDDVTIVNNFTIQNGIFSTAGNTLSVSGIITGASSTTGWVNGYMAKNIGTGNTVSKTYEVGTSTAYAPMTLTFPTVSTAGDVVAFVGDGSLHPIGDACINPDKSIIKLWGIHTVGGVSVSPFNFDANFAFDLSADTFGGVNLSNLKTSVFDGTNWIPSASVPSITATNVSLSGLSISGDYFLAETAPKIGTITGSVMACQNLVNVYTVVGNSCSSTYNWSITGGTFTATGNNISVVWTSTGVNQLAVSSSDGTYDSDANMIMVTVGGVPSATDPITGESAVTVSSQNLIYSVTSVAGVAYMWSVTGGALSPTANMASLVWSVAGTFTLSVTPANTCGTGIASTLDINVASISGIIEPPTTIPGTTITITAGSNTITTDKETLQLTATVSPSGTTVTGINWSVSDTAIAKISASGLVTPVSNGIVTITASVSDDASITSSFMITISGQGGTPPTTTTGIASGLIKGISLYPNPAISAFTIGMELTGTYNVEIYSLQGVSIDKKVIAETSTFNTEKLNAGVYLVKVQSGTASKTFRLVITK